MTEKLNNNRHFVKLREKYPLFTFDSFSIDVDKQRLKFYFDFNISDEYFFRPSYQIDLCEAINTDFLSKEALKTLVFHIGLIEMISYWKATCSPKILINAGSLFPGQLNFLRKIFYHGLGEFRYLNGIDVSQDDFLQIICKEQKESQRFILNAKEKFVVPVGGGKDSVVSLELLKRSGKKLIPFALNPSVAINESIKNAEINQSDVIFFKRVFDKKLIELNDNGFLNGHTPFSALLAFNTLLAASLTSSKWIVLSNESSANEPTVPGTNINHQYSKSLEFEDDFRSYCSEFITEDIHYYSLLRPLNELQIASLFSEFKSHLKTFRSCNVGSKENKWCGSCPKCLFVYIILRPFIKEEELLEIFDKDLLDDPGLKEIFDELTGVSAIKPFECIGTIDEVNASLCRIIELYGNERLPELLGYYRSSEVFKKYSDLDFEKFMCGVSDKHNLSEDILELLKDKLENIKPNRNA